MGHRYDRCDVLDTLEESILLRRLVTVELTNGHRFDDRAKEIIKWEGEDHVVFAHHEFTPISRIWSCFRAYPLEPTYNGKRG